jgi:DNA uptake protein ComE-like DNA-binding protein
VIKHYTHNNDVVNTDFSEFKKEIAKLQLEVKKTESRSKIANKKFVNRKVENKISDFKININTADTTDLKKIYGIGSVLAKRIIKFRDALGGFYDKDQLLQVYGLDSNYYLNYENQLFVDSVEIKKIDINFVSANTLSKHPYINFNLANSIVNYRNNHGYYESEKDLLNLITIDSIYLKKWSPYLIFNDREQIKRID